MEILTNIEKIVSLFVSDKDWFEKKQLMENYPILRDEQAMSILSGRLEGLSPEDEAHAWLIDHQQMIGYCRRVGVETDFSYLLGPPDLEAIFNELNWLNRPGDQPIHLLF